MKRKMTKMKETRASESSSGTSTAEEAASALLEFHNGDDELAALSENTAPIVSRVCIYLFCMDALIIS